MASIDKQRLSRRLGARVSPRRRDPVARSLQRFRRSVRARAAATFSEGFFRTFSAAAKLHPLANPERHNVEITRDVAYSDSGSPDHMLDIYRPKAPAGARLPVVVYVHGGGFRLLSKDTHWPMALIFARFGFLVFNISYRLAPKHPFPAAIADTCAAYEWVCRNAEQYGGDLDRMIVAGESAGANLVTSLSVATCYERPEPYAQRAFQTGITPRIAMPYCGILQVTDTERFTRRRKLMGFVQAVLDDVSKSYLRGVRPEDPRALDLADPLVLFERGDEPDRPLPAFFAAVGTRDPLLDDTRRLKKALDQLEVACEARYYEGEVHAFHAFVFRKPARECWRHSFEFIGKHMHVDMPS
jgi:acetyl esterase